MDPQPEMPERNLALELVRVTEAAAMAAARFVGRGDKDEADGAAVAAMRTFITSVAMNGTVVIGEGEKDNAPMLFNGEKVGDGTGLTPASRPRCPFGLRDSGLAPLPDGFGLAPSASPLAETTFQRSSARRGPFA